MKFSAIIFTNRTIFNTTDEAVADPKSVATRTRNRKVMRRKNVADQKIVNATNERRNEPAHVTEKNLKRRNLDANAVVPRIATRKRSRAPNREIVDAITMTKSVTRIRTRKENEADRQIKSKLCVGDFTAIRMT